MFLGLFCHVYRSLLSCKSFDRALLTEYWALLTEYCARLSCFWVSFVICIGLFCHAIFLIGLFWHSVGLFWQSIDLLRHVYRSLLSCVLVSFCHVSLLIGLFWHSVGLFWQNIGLFVQGAFGCRALFARAIKTSQETNLYAKRAIKETYGWSLFVIHGHRWKETHQNEIGLWKETYKRDISLWKETQCKRESSMNSDPLQEMVLWKEIYRREVSLWK